MTRTGLLQYSDPNLVWSPVNSRERITKLIDNPKNSLHVENEEMLDKKIEDHLIFAAQRGVDVSVVMSIPLQERFQFAR